MHMLPHQHQYDDNVKDIDTTAVAKDESRFRRLSFGITTKVVALSGLVFLTLVSLYNTVQVQYNVPRYLNAYTYATDNVDLSRHLPPLPLSTSKNSLRSEAETTAGAEPIKVNVTHKEQRRPIEYYIGRDKKGNEVLLQDDLSALVDIAYIGHSKCGSSSIQSWFKNHDEIYINQRGREDKVMQNGPLNAVKFAYKSYPNNGKLISYKQPSDINDNVSLSTIQNYFPHTKLIIGIRHPVLWFQSFYNFWEGMAARNSKLKHLPSNTSELIGPCLPNVTKHVCTDHARFHLQIARVLGNRGAQLPTETIFSDREVKLLGVNANAISSIRAQRVHNPVFIYDMLQMADKTNYTRSTIFKENFRQFLGVQNTFPEVPTSNKGKDSRRKIDICHDSHRSVRAVLMEHSRNTAAWIREFLLHSEDDNLFFSSKEYFEELLDAYNHDPCDDEHVS